VAEAIRSSWWIVVRRERLKERVSMRTECALVSVWQLAAEPLIRPDLIAELLADGYWVRCSCYHICKSHNVAAVEQATFIEPMSHRSVDCFEIDCAWTWPTQDYSNIVVRVRDDCFMSWLGLTTCLGKCGRVIGSAPSEPRCSKLGSPGANVRG
jgi:hypothetical protein